MERFKNILLIAGGDNWNTTSLKRAVALAKNNSARLTVVDVVGELPRELGVVATSRHRVEVQSLVVAERLKQLEQHIEAVVTNGIRVNAKVLVGKPFLEIIREVLKKKHDLVMKTAQGEGRLKEAIFGSTAMHLLRKCPCPVWMLMPTHRRHYVKILAAVDPDPIDADKNALNTNIMELATSLARTEGSELHVTHCWSLYGETLLMRPGGMSRSEVAELAREAQTEHGDRLYQLVERHAPALPNNRVHLLKGDAEALIPALARRKNIEIIVMGTVVRTGIAGFIVGNTAENILQRVDCSVLTVKPNGFVSPVRLS